MEWAPICRVNCGARRIAISASITMPRRSAASIKHPTRQIIRAYWKRNDVIDGLARRFDLTGAGQRNRIMDARGPRLQQ